MKKLTADKIDSLWSKTKERSEFMQNILIEVEEMAEFGPTCAKIVSQDIGITIEDAESCIRRLVISGALQKCKNKMRIGGEMQTMYQIPSNEPRQAKLIEDTPPQRDWLVAAFFGETACATP